MAYIADTNTHLRIKFTGGDDRSAFVARAHDLCNEENLVYCITTTGSEWVSISIRPRSSNVSADEAYRIAKVFEQVVAFVKEQVLVSGS